MTDDRKRAAVRRLERAVLLREMARSTYYHYQGASGGYARRMARRLLQAADTAVREAVITGRADGLSRGEMAGIIGVSVSRIADVLKAPAGS
ncbi:hypothetical protein [Embleya sp. AB8]|uniref:hypothetical protein n=1 Tax=Embleya sp. AB8 TaxID=3156304 RepID=UPI003C7652CE